jgi:small conductance mechanosensitive channel
MNNMDMDNMDKVLLQIQTWLAEYGLKVIAAILIFVIGRIVARWLTRVLGRVMQRSNVDPTLSRFAERGIFILLMLVVIMAALDQVGVQTTSLVAVLGAAGLAVGLALQGSLANFAAGVMIIMFRPFKIGDYIEAGGTAGIVEAIGIFTTNMKTPDNRVVIVPNAQITGDTITNFSANDTRRLDLVFGVSYGDDLKAARAIFERVLSEDQRVLKEPKHTIGVGELGASSVDFVVRPWVKGSDYWGVKFDLLEKIKVELEAGGCSIPFPQRDVHLFEEKTG